MKNNKIVILISGKAGSGKSYYANLIKINLNKNDAIITPFAKNVKNPLGPACFEMFKRSIRELSKEDKEVFRPVMQAYGQVGRAISPDYWVDKTKEEIDNVGFGEDKPKIFIIDDCRFENELNAFNDYNVIKVRLNRTSANKNVNQDSSETGLDHIEDKEFDIVVNDETHDIDFMNDILGIILKIKGELND